MPKTKATIKMIPVMLFCTLVVLACAHTGHHTAIEEHGAGIGLYQELVDIYTGPLNHMRAVRRGSCAMWPSCSDYSRQAITRYGFLRGWVMTMERLMRCGRDETRLAPKILVKGLWKYHDPVEANAIWLSAKPGLDTSADARDRNQKRSQTP